MDSDIIEFIEHEEEDNKEPDVKRFVSVIDMVEKWIEDSSSEVAESSTTNMGKQPYPSLSVITIILRTVTMDAKLELNNFEKMETELNKKYGNPIYKEYNMSYREATERLQNLLDLWNSSGAGYIDEKYAYYPDREPDSLNFTDWGED